MKYVKTILCIPALLLFSCGGPNPIEDAQAVCDCFTKANSLPEEDPQRSVAQDQCSEDQLKRLEKYHSVEEEKNFNDALAECSKTIIENSLKENL